MPGFITNQTNVTIEQINNIVNFTEVSDFYVRINHFVFNDVFFFVLLLTLAVVFYLAATRLRDQPLNNAMYAGALCTVLAFLLRGVTSVIDGVKYSLINDHQLWVFPIITIVLAGIIWAIKDR